MSNTSTLTKDQLHYDLNAATAFKQLEISAQITNLNKSSALPILELKLKNDKEIFTLLLHEKSNTQEYAKLDVLSTTGQLLALRHTLFNKLRVTITQPELLEENQEITLQFCLTEL